MCYNIHIGGENYDENKERSVKMDLNTTQFSSLFDELVPGVGPADTIAGEIIRAVNRLVYRAWNDGDMFWQDYGIETVGPVYMYLHSLDLQNDSFYRVLDALDALEGKEFDDYYYLLQDLIDATVDLINDNSLLKAMRNDDDCLNNCYYEQAFARFGDPNEDEDLDEYDEDSYDPDGEYGSDY